MTAQVTRLTLRTTTDFDIHTERSGKIVEIIPSSQHTHSNTKSKPEAYIDAATENFEEYLKGKANKVHVRERQPNDNDLPAKARREIPGRRSLGRPAICERSLQDLHYILGLRHRAA